MNYLPRSGQIRPGTYDERSFFNYFRGLQQHGYNPSPGNHSHHTYPTGRRNAVTGVPTLHAQTYHQAPTSWSMNPQYGPHTNRHDFDYQDHHSGHSDHSEGTSTAALVGSRAPQHFFAPPPTHYNPYATAQTGDPCVQAAHSQVQHEPLFHGVPYGRTTRPAHGHYSRLSNQHGGPVQHPTDPHASSMPNPGPVPTSYNIPPAWPRFPQHTYASPPGVQYPSFASMTTSYSGVPIQQPNVNAPGYQPYAQPTMNDPSGGLANNAVVQDQYPRGNNNKVASPIAILLGATRSSRRNRRGKGKRNVNQ